MRKIEYLRIFSLWVLVLWIPVANAELTPELQHKGVLTVAVYKDFYPYSKSGHGIDIEIARQLAKKLNLDLKLLPFLADDSMGDDLRNMIWKGTVISDETADLMLHAPTEEAFATRNPQVTLFSPYYREDIRLAYNASRLSAVTSMSDLQGARIGVVTDSFSETVLASANGGALANFVYQFVHANDAYAALEAGEIDAVMGQGGLAQHQAQRLSGVNQMMAPLAGRVPPAGWPFGLAVERNKIKLIKALESAMKELEQSGEIDRIFKLYGIQRLHMN